MIRTSVEQQNNFRSYRNHWQTKNFVSIALLPLSVLYGLYGTTRRIFYRLRNRVGTRLPAMVIVVGNISVRGTGKSPVVIWLVRLLKAVGYRPGVICRAADDSAISQPQLVTTKSDPACVGDEAVLIAKRSRCPVALGRQRTEVGKALVKQYNCNVLICYGGLQDYGVIRDIEVLVVDGKRRYGNGYCLPSGPLRESAARVRNADFIVCNGRAMDREYAMGLSGATAVNLMNPQQQEPLSGFRNIRVNALAGIEDPSRYFDMLRAHGLEVNEHVFPSDHTFTSKDLGFEEDAPLLMTEKDAMKIKPYAKPNHWYVPISAVLGKKFAERLIRTMKQSAQQRSLAVEHSK